MQVPDIIEELNRLGAAVDLNDSGEIAEITLTLNHQCPRSFFLLSRLPQFPVLTLVGNGVTDLALCRVGGMPALEVLRLQGCSDVSDHGIRFLEHLHRLKVISLVGTGITGVGLKGIAKLSGLAELCLSDAGTLTDDDLRCLQRLEKLQILYIRGSRFTDDGLRALTGIRSLEELNVNGWSINRIDGLAEFTNLRLLRFYDTTISHDACESLRDVLSKCRVFSLSTRRQGEQS